MRQGMTRADVKNGEVFLLSHPAAAKLQDALTVAQLGALARELQHRRLRVVKCCGIDLY